MRRGLLLIALMSCGVPGPAESAPPSPSPAAESTRGAPAAEGTLPATTIQSVVRAHFGAFRKCYEAGLVREPRMAGVVTIRFVIERDGSVRSTRDAYENDATADAEFAKAAADGKPGRLADATVVNCLAERFKDLKFPVPQGPGVVTVAYPIVFNPGD